MIRRRNEGMDLNSWHVWGKWSVNTTYTYEQATKSSTARYFFPTTVYCGTSYSMNLNIPAYAIGSPTTITITASNYRTVTSKYVSSVGSSGLSNMNYLQYVDTYRSDYVQYKTTYYYFNEIAHYAKGSTYYGTVKSADPDAYPADGKSGDYWYVKLR